MTRLKLTASPMAALRAAAKDEADRFFDQEAAAMTHRDAAYAAKRDLAERVIAGGQSEQLNIEAELRGVLVLDLARDILSKPDTVGDRETRRQAVLARIRAAETPTDLAQVMKTYG